MSNTHLVYILEDHDIYQKILLNLTSESSAGEWQHSERQGFVWHGSTSLEHRTPPSQCRGCDPTGSDAASRSSAAGRGLLEEFCIHKVAAIVWLLYV